MKRNGRRITYDTCAASVEQTARLKNLKKGLGSRVLRRLAERRDDTQTIALGAPVVHREGCERCDRSGTERFAVDRRDPQTFAALVIATAAGCFTLRSIVIA